MPEPDALPRLYDEWAAIRQRRNLSEAAFCVVLRRMATIEAVIATTEASDFHALLVKARMALYFAREGGGAALLDGHPDASRDVLASLVRDLRRLAGADPGRRCTAAAAAGDAALLALFERRKEAVVACNGGHDDDTIDRLADIVAGIEEAIAATPATTVAGVRLKFSILEDSFTLSTEETITGRVAASALADLDRLAAGGAL